jgi:dynein heavy chain, axonemal
MLPCDGKTRILLLHLQDELDMIVNDIRPIMKAAQPGVPDTWENLYAFFLNRVRDNLHVILAFSPVGNKFSRRAMQFPGLINGTTIGNTSPRPACCWRRLVCLHLAML